jgi:hypothetical protein
VADLTTLQAILKDYWTPEKVIEQSYLDRPFYGLMPKRTVYGGAWHKGIEYAHPGGAGADYGTARRNATPSRYKQFVSPTFGFRQYQRVLIPNDVILGSESDEGAITKAVTEVDKGFRGLGEKTAIRLVRTQGGTIGQMANSTTSTNVITLADPADANNFEFGMHLQFSTTDGTGSLLASGAYVSVTAIDRIGGTVTTDASPDLATAISGITTTSFCFQESDYNACLPGLADWVPIGSTRTAKLAATFFGVPRSDDPVRLGGVYLDGTRMGGIDEVLIKLGALVQTHGGRTSHVFMNPLATAALQTVSYSKLFAVQSMVDVGIKYKGQELAIGYTAMRAIVGGQPVMIFSDPSWPTNRLDMIEMSSWELLHLGDEPIGFLGEKVLGGDILWPARDYDAVEAMLGGYMWPACGAPGHNGAALIAVT